MMDIQEIAPYYRPDDITLGIKSPELEAATRAALAVRKWIQPVLPDEKRNKNAFISIDMSNAFLDNRYKSQCELPVAGTGRIAASVCDMLYTHPDLVSGITVIGDSHPAITDDCCLNWEKEDGTTVNPNTLVTLDMLRSREVRPAFAEDLDWLLYSLEEMEKMGEPGIMAWITHSLTDTAGANTIGELRTAFHFVAVLRKIVIRFLRKGNIRQGTWYGAYGPLVKPWNYDETMTNRWYMEEAVRMYDNFIFFGVAADYCFPATLRQWRDYFFATDLRWGRRILEHTYIPYDWTALVFEINRTKYEDFLDEMRDYGVKVVHSSELPDLLAA